MVQWISISLIFIIIALLIYYIVKTYDELNDIIFIIFKKMTANEIELLKTYKNYYMYLKNFEELSNAESMSELFLDIKNHYKSVIRNNKDYLNYEKNYVKQKLDSIYINDFSQMGSFISTIVSILVTYVFILVTVQVMNITNKTNYPNKVKITLDNLYGYLDFLKNPNLMLGILVFVGVFFIYVANKESRLKKIYYNTSSFYKLCINILDDIVVEISEAEELERLHAMDEVAVTSENKVVKRNRKHKK